MTTRFQGFDEPRGPSGPIAGRFARRPQGLFRGGNGLGSGRPTAEALSVAARAPGEAGGDRSGLLGIVQIAEPFLQFLERRDEALAAGELRPFR